MNHDVTELLPFYLNGTLDAADRARVETELATCNACRTELDDLRELAGVLRARAATLPPAPARSFERARAKTAALPLAVRLRTAWWGAPARYAAAVVLVASVSAGAVAAWHVRETALSSSAGGNANGGAGSALGTIVYRFSPGPRAAAAPPPNAASASVARRRRATTVHLTLAVGSETAAFTAARIILGNTADAASDSATPATTTLAESRSSGVRAEVPAGRLEGTLDRLTALGTVRHRAVDDVDLEAVLREDDERVHGAQHEVELLRRTLPGSPASALGAAQLRRARDAVVALTARREYDLHRARFSTIELTLVARPRI